MLSRAPQLPVYDQLPLTLTSGSGPFVYDEAGNEYLDMYGGHAVAATGHCHPRVVRAVKKQAGDLLFYSNAVHIPARAALCEKLVRMGPEGARAVFLCNSGAEANENALTLARLATGRSGVVSFAGGFHGRTLLTLSICGIDRYRSLATVKDGPLFPHARIVPFGDARTASEAIDDTCAAVIIEPVQGLAGCVAASEEFLVALRRACDRSGAFLIFDEIQCGTGRCGAFCAGQLSGVSPDLTTLAKGLGGGFPIGAVLAGEKAVAAASVGALGSTFGGGPLACAAALANLEVIEEEGMIENARRVGERLQAALASIPGVERVQGAGLLLGIVLDRKARPVLDRLLGEHRIIAGGAAYERVLRIMPPLNLPVELADRFSASLENVLTKGST